MARITIPSDKMRRSFRDVLVAVERGDEIIVTHWNRPAARITAYTEPTRPAEVIDGLSVLRQVRHHLPAAVAEQIAAGGSPDAPAGADAGRQVRSLAAHYGAASHVAYEALPWVRLADELGEDGSGDLPAMLPSEAEDYIRATAADHVGRALARIAERERSWPTPSSDHVDLQRQTSLIAEQAADTRFVAMLTPGLDEVA